MQVNYIDWHVTPFRADRWMEIWRPALDRALAFGASASYIGRSEDDPLLFRQVTIWDERTDFERYWYSEEISSLRESAISLYHKPVLPVWHNVVADAAIQSSNGRS